MLKQKNMFILCAIILLWTTIPSIRTVASDGYTLGTYTVTSCNAPGMILDDLTTWFCDPKKYIVFGEDDATMRCERKLRPGFYPVLKSVDAGDVDEAIFEFVLATPCSDACRTWLYNEDFTNGDPDYCTSCDLEVKPVLDIGGDKPTWVLNVPDQRAVLVIQNNRMLGVSANVTKYGGESSDGNRTEDASMPPDSDKSGDVPDGWEDEVDDMVNAGDSMGPPSDGSGSGSGSGGPPPGGSGSGSGSGGPPPGGSGSGSGSGGMPPPQRLLEGEDSMNDTETMDGTDGGFSEMYPPPMNDEDNFVDYMQTIDSMGDEADLPKVTELIDGLNILGFGKAKEDEEMCSMNVGEDRKPKGVQPGIVLISIPCPADCDQCIISKLGSLMCTVPASGFKLMNGMPIDTCPATGYAEYQSVCISCSKNKGCDTCTINTDSGKPEPVCTQCASGFSENPDYTADPTPGSEEGGTTMDPTTNSTDLECLYRDQCIPDMCCQGEGMYYDGSTCASCGDNCMFCKGDKCAICQEGFFMFITETGERQCVEDCGPGFYVDDQHTCRACDASCDLCMGKGSDRCTTCPEGKLFLSPQMLRLDKNNMKAEFEMEMYTEEQTDYYVEGEDVIFEGMCVDECALFGLALWNNNGECNVCEPYGCTACDATGVCTECSKEHGLSLVTYDDGDNSMLVCEPCWVYGCAFCMDDNVDSCKMCAPGFALESDDQGMNYCTEKCDVGMFAEEQTIDATEISGLVTTLTHKVCSPCTGDCMECKGAADFCTRCNDPSLFASAGTCAASCEDGFFGVDGTCKKCGMNIATCHYDADTEMKAIDTCEDGFFISSNGAKCVMPESCGKGYFANTDNGLCDMCDMDCETCKGAADFCTKCSDYTLFLSSDGTCKAAFADVTCPSYTFRNDDLSKWLPCDPSCDKTAGCVGKTSKQCKACSEGFVVNGTTTTSIDGSDVTLFSCAKQCPKFSEIRDVDSQKTCIVCSKEETTTIFDMSTKTCVSEADGCPAGTIKTTADALLMKDSSAGSGTNADITTIDVCAMCDPRCETCLAENPGMCETCKSDLFTNEVEMFDQMTNSTITGIKCTKECLPGTFPDADGICSGMWFDGCAKCDDDSTCSMCMTGFFLDTSTGSDLCVDQMSCPAGYYGDKSTGMCETWESPCSECGTMKNWCTACEDTFTLFAEVGKCFASWPIGSFLNDTVCSPCASNILNCDQTTGEESTVGMTIPCDNSCSTCFWNSAYCIGCAEGKVKAPFGQCLDQCPMDTYEVNMDGMTYCESCSKGCLKCVSEVDMCMADGSYDMSQDASIPEDLHTVPKCLRCDKDLGFYLFQGNWVRECPHGTYADKITGWCSKCDCNCGGGGCIDRNTCKSCPSDNMIIDINTGRCICDTAVTAEFTDDWSAITITIDSKMVRFRDQMAEWQKTEETMNQTMTTYENEMDSLINDMTDVYNQIDYTEDEMNAALLNVTMEIYKTMDKLYSPEYWGNAMKVCRIGNEGSIFDSSDDDITSIDDVAYMRCGDYDNTVMELEYILYQFGMAKFINYTDMDEMVGDFSTTESSTTGVTSSGGPKMTNNNDYNTTQTGQMGSGGSDMMGEMEDGPPSGMRRRRLEDVPDDQDMSDMPSVDDLLNDGFEEDRIITDDNGYCPASEETFSMNDLKQMGMNPEKIDIFKYIRSLEYIFGNIPHEELGSYQSPTEGLVFTEQPGDLCYQLFDEEMMYILGNPNCTYQVTDTSTVIQVKIGQGSYIHPKFTMKVQPNVFVDGCDWPVMDVVEVADGLNPEGLTVNFMDTMEMSAVSCQPFDFGITSENGVGMTQCMVLIDAALDSNGDIIDSEDVWAIIDEMNGYTEDSDMTYDSGSAENNQGQMDPDHMQALMDLGASFVSISATCWDQFDQEQVVHKDIELTGSSDAIQMDASYSEVFYNCNDPKTKRLQSPSFSYASCGEGGSTQVNSTAILQVSNGDGTWTTVGPLTNNTIPTTLDCSEEYQVVFVAESGEQSDNFTVPISYEQPQPRVMSNFGLDKINPANDFSRSLSESDFKNVNNISDSSFSLYFECTPCGEQTGTCLYDNETEIDFNTYYDNAAKTIMIPSGDLPYEKCYRLDGVLSYMGFEIDFSIQAKTKKLGVSQEVEGETNFRNGDYKDPMEGGRISCHFNDSDVESTGVVYDDMTVTTSDGTNLIDTLDCLTLVSPTEAEYTAGCLPEGETIFVTCGMMANSSNAEGTAAASFSTSSSVTFDATISPTSGTTKTDFTISVDNTYESTLLCKWWVKESDSTDGSPNNVRGPIQVDTNAQGSFNPRRLRADKENNFVTVVRVRCLDINNSDAVKTVEISVPVTKYQEADNDALNQEDATTFASNFDSYSPDEVVELLEDLSEAVDYMDDSLDVIGTISTLIQEYEGEDFTADTAQSTMTVFQAASRWVKKKGVSGDSVDLIDSMMTTMFGPSGSSQRRLAEGTNEVDTVRNTGPQQGTDSVAKMSTSQIKNIAQIFDDYLTGILENKDLLTQVQYEKAKRLFMKFVDKISKAAPDSLSTGESLNLPLENFYIYLQKLDLSEDNLDNKITVEYECPCSDNYQVTASPTSDAVIDGTVDLSSVTTPSTASAPSTDPVDAPEVLYQADGGQLDRMTDVGKCYVKLPTLRSIETYTADCESVVVAVITTSELCANSEVSSEDSATFMTESGTDSAAQLTAVSGSTTTYDTSAIDSSGTTVSTSDYSDMKCTGPSLEVTYFCLESTTADSTTSQMQVSRLQIDQIVDDYVEYSMNCPAVSDTYDSSQEETCSFLDESTGENSADGCAVTDYGTVQCVHFTSFGYSKSTLIGGGSKDWEERLYSDFVLYIILLFDGYLLLALAAHFIIKDEKKGRSVKIIDQSMAKNKLPHDNIMDEKQGYKVENASSMDKISSHSQAEIDGLHKKSFGTRFCKGLSLKYRLVTPFTTPHDHLSRAARGFINITTLFAIWTFSGIMLMGIESTAGAYISSLIICYLIARGTTNGLDFFFKNRNNIALTASAYIFTFCILVILHVAVILITKDMESEFDNWGVLLLLVLIVDLIIWEIASLLIQLHVAKNLASKPDAYSGRRKTMESLITPPLLNAHIDP